MLRAPPYMLWTVAIVAIGAGCGPDRSQSGSGYGGSDVGTGGTGGAGSSKPMLVVVDPDRVMHATAGQGVGVFTEYQTGGHWRVWWTCDTAKTSQACRFDVIATVADGALGNAAGLSPGDGIRLSQANAQSVEALTTTTENIEGMTFDSTAGATITLDAQVGGLRDGSFLFFVQDGKINGGYTATLTDPLMLQPLAP
jgi:hypothetical protein